MNSITIWIILPLVISITLLIIQPQKLVVQITGGITAILLAWLAWQLPVGQTITLEFGIANPSFFIGETITALGRMFTLTDNDRPALLLFYFSLSLWYGGSYFTKAHQHFTPLALAAVSMLAASLTIRPDLYAIIFIELAALIFIPILSPPGSRVTNGVIRFLIFQTVGMCFILFSNWSLAQFDINAPVLPNLIILTLGLSLVLATFPFHIWMTTLAREVHPYSGTLIFVLIPLAIVILIANYTNRMVILGFSQEMFLLLRIMGAIMIIMGGLWSFFEDHLGRVIAFATILQIGMTLLAFSLIEGETRASSFSGLYFAQLVSMTFGILILALAISVISDHQPDLSFKTTRGLLYSLPFAGSATILSLFSLAGFPLLASFPIFYPIWTARTGNYLSIILFTLAGNVLLFTAGIRILYNFTSHPDVPPKKWQSLEPKIVSFLLAFGVGILLLLGMFPGLILPNLIDMGILFIRLGQ